jgi:regulator of protease activity HflC (stomatin/prohibitin superfamily)
MRRLAFVLVLMATTSTLSACGVETVQQGTTGIKKSYGKVEEQGYSAGLYFYNPFISSMFAMDNHVQKMTDKSNVFTKDVQKADVEWALNYALKPEASLKMYTTVGHDWENILLPQIINGSMKNTIGQWNAVELVSNRDKAATEIEAAIAKELEPYGVSITGFQLVDIQYDPAFDEAIKNKVIAIQKAEQSQNETVQVQEQAKQKVITADADAQAMKIKSEALSQNQNLVAYEAVQKWDGHYPTVMAGNGGMMLNIPMPGAEK